MTQPRAKLQKTRSQPALRRASRGGAHNNTDTESNDPRAMIDLLFVKMALQAAKRQIKPARTSTGRVRDPNAQSNHLAAGRSTHHKIVKTHSDNGVANRNAVQRGTLIFKDCVKVELS